MDYWLIAVILKPLGVLVVFGLICLPIRYLVHKRMPEGRVKNELLKHRWGHPDSLTR